MKTNTFKLESFLLIFLVSACSQSTFTEFSIKNLTCDTNNGNIIWQGYVRYFPQCVLQCDQNITCKSVGYGESNGNCTAYTQILPEVNETGNCGINIKYAEKLPVSMDLFLYKYFRKTHLMYFVFATKCIYIFQLKIPTLVTAFAQRSFRRRSCR